MRRLELSLVFLSFNRHTAFERFLGVLLVGRELSQSLVVSSLSRVRWLESLVVNEKRGSLRFLRSLRDRWVLCQNLLVGVEGVSLFDFLREGFILNQRLMQLTSCLLEQLRSVVVIFHVRDGSTKCHLSAYYASFHGVSQDVTRGDVNFARVFLVAEVLLDLDKVGHVVEG